MQKIIILLFLNFTILIASNQWINNSCKYILFKGIYNKSKNFTFIQKDCEAILIVNNINKLLPKKNKYGVFNKLSYIDNTIIFNINISIKNDKSIKYFHNKIKNLLKKIEILNYYNIKIVYFNKINKIEIIEKSKNGLKKLFFKKNTKNRKKR